jgi:hypothetical protein
MLSITGEAGSLWQALTAVPDHRRKAGKRYPVASLLLIAVAAMLSGRRDQLGIVRWGRRLTQAAREAIGISRNRVPAPSVWCELFQGLDITALERVLGDWVRGEQPAGHVSIDGKRLRGSAVRQSPGVHLLAAFSAKLQGVIGQLRVAPEANEITAALELLRTLPLAGVIITGDAMFTQREICRVIIDGGGDYFFTVKDNQPALKADIALAFGPDSPLSRMVAAA